MTALDVVRIILTRPNSERAAMPVAEVWDFFESQDYRFHPSEAVVRLEDGTERTAYAKGWFVWDFTAKRYRLTRIGFGAAGESSPIANPHPDLLEAPRNRYVDGDWVGGIRFEGSYADRHAPVSA